MVSSSNSVPHLATMKVYRSVDVFVDLSCSWLYANERFRNLINGVKWYSSIPRADKRNLSC